MARYNGEYGGIVLHPFKGMGTAFIRGVVLSPELVSDWPLANRRALHDSGRIEWYGPPNPEESEVREEGEKTKKVTPPKKAPAADKVDPYAGMSTKEKRAAKAAAKLASKAPEEPAEASDSTTATEPAAKRGRRTK